MTGQKIAGRQEITGKRHTVHGQRTSRGWVKEKTDEQKTG